MERKKAEMVHNGMFNVPDIRIEYRGYVIGAKRDMGSDPWRTNGNTVRRGYVATDGGIINVMPGATWFGSVIEAKAGIDSLIESKETGRNFWDIHREKQGLSEYETV